MKEVICPQCHTAFTIDENNFASIVKQVRDAEFNAEIEQRLEEMTARFAEKVENVKLQCREEYEKTFAKQQLELQSKNGEIAQLNAKLEGADEKLRFAVLEEQGRLKDELFSRDTMIASLKNSIASEKREAASREKTIKEQYEGEMRLSQEQHKSELRYKDEQIA